MTGHTTLTELLQSRLLNKRELVKYGNSKDLDVEMLVGFSTNFVRFKKDLGRLATPLHFACLKNEDTLVDVLLKEGCDVNYLTARVEPPLWIALDNGNISIAQLLVQNGAKVNYTNKYGNTLMTAALNKNKHKNEASCVEGVTLLLNAGISVNADMNNDLKKPIHEAVMNNRSMLLQFLIENGADVNAKDKQNNTPLHLATLGNFCNCIQILICHGADLYTENPIFDTALNLGVKFNSIQAVETLVKNGFNVNHQPSSGLTALLLAVADHNLEMIKILIGLGADPNLLNNFNVCPLHIIAARNLVKSWSEDIKTLQVRKEITEFLVDSGGNINTTPSPLMLAVTQQLFGLAKLFVELGACVNIGFKSSPLHYVVDLNNDLVELFLDYGGDYNCRNDMLTPYMLGVSNKIDVKLLKYFIKFGCPYDENIDIRNVGLNCLTSRLFAAENMFFEGIKNNDLNLLEAAVNAGAVITGCSEQIRYPVHFLAFRGYNQLLYFLLEKGALPNMLNEQGESALYIAAKHGHYDCCCTLLKFGACYNYLNRVNSGKGIQNTYIVNLLKNVGKMFFLTNVGHKIVTAILENLASNNINKYLIYANARNARGNSILAIALNKNHTSIAQKMMNLRIRLGV